VIVDGCDVGARRAADFADGYVLETTIGEQAFGDFEKPRPRLLIVTGAPRRGRHPARRAPPDTNAGVNADRNP
jgi:hypothetical protein